MKLAEWMEAEGLDDEAAAQRVGSTRTTINRIRRGQTRPSWELLAKLTTASDGAVSANDFLPEILVEPAEEVRP